MTAIFTFTLPLSKEEERERKDNQQLLSERIITSNQK
jgi:hypothetical protein